MIFRRIIRGIPAATKSCQLKFASQNYNHLQKNQNNHFLLSIYAKSVLCFHQNRFSFSQISHNSEKILKQLQQLKSIEGQNTQKYLAALNQLALAYTTQNNNDKAIEVYKDLLSRLKQNSHSPPHMLAKYLKALQVLLFNSNKLQESIIYQEELVNVATKIKGQNSKQVAKECNLLAQICFKAHKIQSAIIYFQKSLQIYNVIQANNHGKDAKQTLNQEEFKQRLQLMINTAYSNWSIGRKQKTQEYFIKSRQMLITKNPINFQLITQVLMNLSILKQLNNSLDQSLKYCQELQILFQQNQKSKGKSQLFNQIGKIYLKKRKFQQCQKYLLQAEKLIFAQNSKHSSKLAQTYQMLANLYQTKDDKPKALQTYQKLLNLVKTISKQGNQFFLANTYNSIGNLLLIMKQFQQARLNFKQSQALLLVIWNKKPQDSYINQTLGDTYYNIGKTFHDQIKFNEAVEWYQKGKQFYEKSKKLSSKLKLINAYRGLGLTYFNGPKNKQKTIQNFIKSSTISQEMYPNHPDLKMQYALIFDSLYSLGRLQQALIFTHKILAINEHQLRTNSNNMQSLLGAGFQKYFQGLIYYKLNSYQKAKQSLLDAEQKFKKLFFDNKNSKIHQNVIFTSILLQQIYKKGKNDLQAQNEAKKVENYTRLALQHMPAGEKKQEHIKKFILGAKQFILNKKQCSDKETK